MNSDPTNTDRSPFINCHGESHVGLKRTRNEDQFLIASLRQSIEISESSLAPDKTFPPLSDSQASLLVVADGLGGHAAGDRASALAVGAVTDHLVKHANTRVAIGADELQPLDKVLANAFEFAQSRIAQEANQFPERRSMATTLTVAYVQWPNALVAHAGDTRCYHVTDNQIKQLTTDHTIGSILASIEKEANEPADTDSQDPKPIGSNHALFNVLGGNDPSLQTQIESATLKVGDSLLLCSDGLTKYVSDDELALLANNHKKSAKEVSNELIELANERGGGDNITVILSRFLEQPILQKNYELKSTSSDTTADTDEYHQLTIGH